MKRIFLLLCSLLAIHNSSVAEDYASINIQGELVTNACSGDNRASLRQSVFERIPSELTAQKAWNAIDALLCQPHTAANQRFVLNLLPKKVRSSMAATGDEDKTSLLERNDELADSLISSGKAWDATIQKEKYEIVLEYSPNEACIRTLSLKLLSGDWKIVSISEACD